MCKRSIYGLETKEFYFYFHFLLTSLCIVLVRKNKRSLFINASSFLIVIFIVETQEQLDRTRVWVGQ